MSRLLGLTIDGAGADEQGVTGHVSTLDTASWPARALRRRVG
jgi:hypothetical protein